MKLVIFTSHRVGLASDTLLALEESCACSIVQVILSRNAYPNRFRMWQQRLRKMRQIGPIGALIALHMRSWYESHQTADLAVTCERLGVPFSEVPFTNSEDTERLLRQCAPDLGLSLGSGYISHRIFEIPKYGMLNVHLERLPKYQNARSIIWPIYFYERKTGLTIHQVSRRIDGGSIIFQEEYPIIFHRKLEDTVCRTFEAVLQRAPAAVRYVCENYKRLAGAAKAQENGRKFTTPTFRQFLRMVRNNRQLYLLRKL